MLSIKKIPHGIKIYIWSKNTKGCYTIGNCFMIVVYHFILDASKNPGRQKKTITQTVLRTTRSW